jgi:hypothetical protein
MGHQPAGFLLESKSPFAAAWGPNMPDDDFNERERALQYAARLKGLALMRTGETYALVQYKMTGATLDEIEACLRADGGARGGDRRSEDSRRADLRALLKAEHSMLVELEEEKRRLLARGRGDKETENALAEIRRRIAELQSEKKAGGSSGAR